MWSGKHLELAGYDFGQYVGERIVVWLMRGGAGWVGGWWRGLVMEGVAFEDDGRNNEKMPGFFFFFLLPFRLFFWSAYIHGLCREHHGCGGDS